MSAIELSHLIAHAARLGGTDLCSDGHAWKTEGGRPCPWDLVDGRADADCGGSQPVEVCARCGETDYGEPGGPGFTWCVENCRDGLQWFTADEAARLLKP